MTDADDPLVQLYRAPDAAEAALLVHALKAAGVPARSVGGALQWAWGELGADALMVEIWVPRDRVDEARRSIEDFYARRADGERSARAESPPWTCACGEANDAGFEICWSCQGRRAS